MLVGRASLPAMLHRSNPSPLPKPLSRSPSMSSLSQILPSDETENTRAAQEILAPILENDVIETPSPRSSASTHNSIAVDDLMSMIDSLDKEYRRRASIDLRTIPSLQSLTSNQSEDDVDLFCDSALLSPQSSFPAYHLPRSAPRPPALDSDALSTSSTISYSTLSTPSLSRASSYQRLYASPPITPITSSSSCVTSPEETPHTSLGVIQEAQNADDHTILDHSFFDEGNSDASSVTSSHTQRIEVIGTKTRRRMGVHDLQKLQIGSEVVHHDERKELTSPSALSLVHSPTKAAGAALSRLFNRGDKVSKKKTNDPPKSPSSRIFKGAQPNVKLREAAESWSYLR